MSEHPDPQSLSGQLIAHYRVVRHLGSGGMGEVFLAEDTKLDRPVALKLLPKGVAEDASRRKRFLAEAKAASALNHSSVCTIYEVGETPEGQPFIAMEYLEGQTLDVLARRRRLDLREIVAIGVQVAEALEAARQSQVVHRDIKPGNIVVLTPNSEPSPLASRPSSLTVKVLDFGLAKRLDQTGEASVMTQAGAILGTPNYLSPELALGREVDSRSDIFSLGVVLYELAAGRNPFAGASFGETVNNVLNHAPASIRPWNPTVTPDFERIVFKCLEKDVAKRYAAPRELAAGLRRLEATQDGRDARNGKVLWMLATAGVTACLLALIAWQFLRPLRPVTDHGQTPGAAQTSLAPTTLSRQRLVLMPFKSLASGEANEIFTEGLVVELFSRLSRIRGLQVINGSDFVKAQGEGKDFSARWRELNVGVLLKGTVLQEQKQMRIWLQLLDSQTQEILKTFDFDRELKSLLALQTEAAGAIASALEVELLPEERRQLARRPTENSQAYQVYLEGRAFWNRRTGKDITNAIVRFNQAIAEDPAYALAHAGLADCYVILPEYASRPSGDAFPKARAAALDALKYDSTLAEPHATLAYIKAYFDWDWSGAEAEFRRAIALNPRYATAHHWLAVVLGTMRRYDDALAEIKLAQEIDPLSPIINATYGSYLFFAGTPDLAVKVLKKQIAQDPSFVGAHNSLGLVYAYQGKWPETIAEFETVRRLDQNGAFGLDLLGLAYARAGRTNEARKVLSHLLELQRQGLELRINIATVLHGLGDDEGALKSLEEGLADHALGLDWMNSEPYLKDLRAHPRAQAILRMMNLVK
jgi:serine/threonine-protein kinase